MNKRYRKQQSSVKKAKDTYHIVDCTQKIPAKLYTKAKLGKSLSATCPKVVSQKKKKVDMTPLGLLKQARLQVKDIRKQVGEISSLVYAEGKVDPDGLDFPDNFMAVLGFKRVTK